MTWRMYPTEGVPGFGCVQDLRPESNSLAGGCDDGDWCAVTDHCEAQAYVCQEIIL